MSLSEDPTLVTAVSCISYFACNNFSVFTQFNQWLSCYRPAMHINICWQSHKNKVSDKYLNKFQRYYPKYFSISNVIITEEESKSLETIKENELSKLVCDINFVLLLCHCMKSKIFYSVHPSDGILARLQASRGFENSNFSILDNLVGIVSSTYKLGLLSFAFIFDLLYQMAIIDAGPTYAVSQGDSNLLPGFSIWFPTQEELKYFINKIIAQFLPIIRNLGPYFITEISKFSAIRGTAESMQLSASIEDLNWHDSGPSLMKGSLPETFLKPFREEMDSRHEYKTKNENAIFNERERCFDEFCNLISRFQQVSKSDFDGSRMTSFYANDVMVHGSTILSLQASNISWFSDMFAKLLLFHSMSDHRETRAKEKTNHKGNINRIQPVAVKVADKDSSKLADNSIHVFSSPPNTVSSNANTISSSHTNTIRKLNINEKQLSKLEERLGSGSIEVPHITSANKPFNKSKSHPEKLSPASMNLTYKDSSSSHSSSSTGRKLDDSSGPGTKSYLQAVTPASIPNNHQSNNYSSNKKHTQEKLDDYEEAAFQFSGIQQFFFRFIVSMNNHRFNQHLVNSISSEIHKLSEEYDNSLPAAFSSDKKQQKEFRGGGGQFEVVGDEMASREFFASETTIALSPETFTVKVMKLKVLGKFLGLLQFYHMWSQLFPLESDDPGTPSPSPLSLYAKESVGLQSRLLLKSVLPINAILMTSLKQGRLCLTVSWVVEFLKMMNWSSLLRLTNFQQYSDTFHLLHCLQLQVASWITNDTNLSFPRLSSNRLYYAMEIQNLFSQCKYDSSAERNASPDFNAVHSQSEDVLDAQSLSFYPSFLRHVLPEMEKYYLLLREQNQLKWRPDKPPPQSPGTSLKLGLAAAKSSAKKRQSPSIVISPQSKPASNEDTRETPTERKDGPSISPPLPPSLYSPEYNLAMSRHPTLSLDACADSPSPNPIRNRSRSSQPTSPTKKSSSKLLWSSSSPSPSTSNGVNQEHEYGNTSLSMSFSYLGINAESSSNLNASFTSETNPASFVDKNTNDVGSTDISERLENAFWTQHSQLHLISQFLVSHTSQACWARVKQQVANAVKEFLTLSSSADLSDSKANNNTSPTRGTNSLEIGLQKSYRQLLDEGRRKIMEFYSDCTADLLPKLFNLYPMDNRVAELAVTLMKGQVSAQMAMMISHLKAYGLRKLKEAYTLTVKQHSKGPNKNVLSAHQTTQLAESEKAIASSQPTQQLLTHATSNARVALASLLEFFNVSTLVEVIDDINSDVFSYFTRERLTIVAKNDYFSLSGSATEGWVLRNKISKFFISVHKVSCCLAEWVKCSGFSMITKISDIRSIYNIDALSIAAENMAAMYSALADSVVGAIVAAEARSSSDSQVARGKLVIDAVKFLTLSVPMILYFDVLLAATRHGPPPGPHDKGDKSSSESEKWEAVDSLAIINKSLSGPHSPPPPLLSDIFFRLVDQSILSESAFIKMLAYGTKRKNAAAFEACRSLDGLQGATSRALGFIISKYMNTYELRLLESRSYREDRRAHMKTLLGDDLFALVEPHIT